MTRDEVIAAIHAAETTAATLRRMLAEIDGLPAQIAPAPTRWINSAQAAKLSRRSYSWLYSTAERYGFGFRLPSGSWQFDQSALLAFLTGVASAQESERREVSDSVAIHNGPVMTDLRSRYHEDGNEQGCSEHL